MQYEIYNVYTFFCCQSWSPDITMILRFGMGISSWLCALWFIFLKNDQLLFGTRFFYLKGETNSVTHGLVSLDSIIICKSRLPTSGYAPLCYYKRMHLLNSPLCLCWDCLHVKWLACKTYSSVFGFLTVVEVKRDKSCIFSFLKKS